jgi:hypothetical protein
MTSDPFMIGLLNSVDPSLSIWVRAACDDIIRSIQPGEDGLYLCPNCKQSSVSMQGYLAFHFEHNKPCRDWLVCMAENKRWNWYWTKMDNDHPPFHFPSRSPAIQQAAAAYEKKETPNQRNKALMKRKEG